ncbi:MAG: YccF domain-containing protein [Anaerolineae bacterium]|jgi:uncharacterized membrane protein YccF (DUF307 family)
MSPLGNFLWLLLGGLVVGLGYIIGGAVLCLTVVGIPFGMQAIRLGVAVLTPFGKEVVPARSQTSLKLLFDVIWILLFGWEIALSHFVLAIVLGITIVGLPFARQHLKLVPIALLPFSQELA